MAGQSNKPGFDLSGCTTALITPFRNGRLDTAGLRANVRFQLSNGISGLLVAGSTGEAASLTRDEWDRAVSTVVSEVKARVRVVVGAGTNSTQKSVAAVRRAKKLGGDAALVVAPYYVRPTQEGLYRHFRTIAEAVDIPIVVYNIPGRTAVNIAPATVERMVRACSNIVAVKEASGNVDNTTELCVRCGDRLTVLSGDDSLTLPILAAGGRGVVSVVSNIVPTDVESMLAAHFASQTARATAMHQELYPLVKALFVETNPIPVKAAMSMLGMAAGEPRLPLTPLSASGRKVVRRALRNHGLKPRR
ncbi:MAG: 4-hydroxy-tetrahydrodipicolinate synthase [candidate division WOR-3 bacterium]|nr:MAG: 4-hydroxy-tetrahydrodipicolinate synthase [candidate division WOR-3 bacterium]